LRPGVEDVGSGPTALHCYVGLVVMRLDMY